MHRIWARVGYRPTDVKLTLRGKHLGGDVYRYNAVHNEFLLNGYVPLRDVLDAVRAIAKRRNIAYIHGYPSAIAELARGCTELAPDVATTLRRTLRGVLLGSEYPAPVYRDRIEQAFGAPTISWYGHSEMAILAGEVDRFLYAPMLSYGLTEAVPDGRGGHRLVGTSYDNVASPFIRYDTGDSIEPVEVRGGILRTFRIASGRVGEYVTDKTGGHVSLTALIFGRHHPIFDTADFLQVRQTSPGAVEILVTPSPGARVTSDDVRAGFDATHVALDIRYTVCQEPIRTPAGKVPLLVR
jgi:phenylacetate-CoA ligase